MHWSAAVSILVVDQLCYNFIWIIVVNIFYVLVHLSMHNVHYIVMVSFIVLTILSVVIHIDYP